MEDISRRRHHGSWYSVAEAVPAPPRHLRARQGELPDTRQSCQTFVSLARIQACRPAQLAVMAENRAGAWREPSHRPAHQ